MEPTRQGSALTIPSAIIIAATIIAIALIYVLKPASSAPATATAPSGAGEVNMAPVTPADHILGNPDAPIKIVEYSDPSCPFCKVFNPTMVQIMGTYGAGGKVAWIYRDFPLDKPDANGNVLHKNAGTEAQAMECAASLGGNDKFWKYQQEWYQNVPQEAGGRSVADDQKQIMQTAKDIGLDTVSFNECLTSGQFKSKVEKEYLDGLNAGVSGTPYSIIITPTGSKIPLPGVQSYATIKSAIDTLISEIK